MIELLENEQIKADLHHGETTRAVESELHANTIVFTDKRLILVKKHMGVFYQKNLFIKDILKLVHKQYYDPFDFVIGFIGLVIGMVLLIAGASAGTRLGGGFALAGLVFFLLAVGFFIYARKNTIKIFTCGEVFTFKLGKSLTLKEINVFIEHVQNKLAKLDEIV